jgi:endonuclease YncB( thermonuclease family)
MDRVTIQHIVITSWVTPARIIEWHDGDTAKCLVEVLPYDWQVKTGRLARINAPELRADGGVEAKAFAQTLAPSDELVALRSHQRENYGRLLADMMVVSTDKDVSNEMVAAGHAVVYGKLAGGKTVEYQP